MPEQDNWIDEFDEKFPELFDNKTKLIPFISSLLSSQAHALKEQMKAKILEKKKKVYDTEYIVSVEDIVSAIESIEI